MRPGLPESRIPSPKKYRLTTSPPVLPLGLRPFIDWSVGFGCGIRVVSTLTSLGLTIAMLSPKSIKSFFVSVEPLIPDFWLHERSGDCTLCAWEDSASIGQLRIQRVDPVRSGLYSTSNSTPTFCMYEYVHCLNVEQETVVKQWSRTIANMSASSCWVHLIAQQNKLGGVSTANNWWMKTSANVHVQRAGRSASGTPRFTS